MDRLRAHSSIALLAILLILSITVLRPFLISLSLGAIFGIALLPLKSKLHERFKIKATLATTLIMIGFVSFILMPIGFVIYKAVEYLQTQAATEKSITHIMTELASKATNLLADLGFPLSFSFVQSQMSVFAGKLRQLLSTAAQDIIVNSPDSALQFTIMLLTMAIFLLKHRQIFQKLLKFGGISRTCLARMMDTVSKVCTDVVFANIITGLVQAILVALAIAALTEWDPALVFIITFITSFIPIIGASPIAILFALIEFYQGRTGTGWGLLATAAVVGVSDNIVRAWLMSSNKDDSSFLNLLGTLGGIYLWGLPGLFLGPFIVSLTVQSTPFLILELEKVYAKKNPQPPKPHRHTPHPKNSHQRSQAPAPSRPRSEDI